MTLVLKAAEPDGPLRWRWLLTDQDTGLLLAEHPVDLSEHDAQLAAFRDLYEHVRWQAAPDRQSADEQRLVGQAGEWAGRVLLGESVGQAIADAAPVTVRIVGTSRTWATSCCGRWSSRTSAASRSRLAGGCVTRLRHPPTTLRLAPRATCG